jgi:hypothetical protein
MPSTDSSISTSTALAVRIAVAGTCAAFVLATTSYLINVLWLGPAHDVLDVFRPEDDPLVVPGLAVSALTWGVLLASGYRTLWRRPSVRPGWQEGAAYGALVCLLFTWIQSVFLFQFIRISPALLLGDLLHYLVASTASGAIIGRIVPRRGSCPHSSSPTADSI